MHEGGVSGENSQAAPCSERRNFIRDLVALSGLPAIWTRATPEEIATGLAQLIVTVVDSDCVCVVFANPPVNAVQWSSRIDHGASLEVPQLLELSEGNCKLRLGDTERDFQLARFPLGRIPGSALIVLCRRPDFPTEEERVVLRLAANQASIATERWHTEQALRHQAEVLRRLNEVGASISANLDTQNTIQTVTDAARELSGAQFGAFFYNVTDQAGERYMLYTLSGAPKEAFSNFPLPRNTAVFEPTFRGQATLRSPNIRKDPRYGKQGPYHGTPPGHLPVVSYLAVPVISRDGTVLGGLFFGHEKEGVFTEESESIVASIASQAAVALDNAKLYEAARTENAERARIQASQNLLLAELNHRVKNTLAVVQSIATQTMRYAPSPEVFQHSFMDRLIALASVHDLLSETDWSGVSLRRLLELVLSPFSATEANRYSIEGTDVMVEPSHAVNAVMLLHELATNCAKYGALSTTMGRVLIAWQPSGPRHSLVEWREVGGPRVKVPQQPGFGSQLIKLYLSGQPAESAWTFLPDGVVCRFLLATCNEQVQPKIA